MECEQLIQALQPTTTWVDYFSALLVPTIALVALLVGTLQWRTNRSRLKHELFDRRYAQYEGVVKFIAKVTIDGKTEEEDKNHYLDITKGMEFTFDKAVYNFVVDVWSVSAEINSLFSILLVKPEGEEKEHLKTRLAQAKEKAISHRNNLNSIFHKYLSLKH